MIEETKHLQNQNLFESKIFENHVIEKDFSITGDVKFRNCTFRMPFVLENIDIKGRLMFYKCVFHHTTSIKNCSATVISISDCELLTESFKLISNKSNFLDLGYLKAKEIYINGDYNIVFFKNIIADILLLKDINSIYSRKDSKVEFTNLTIEKLELKGTSIHADILIDRGNFKNIFLIGHFKNSINIVGDIKVEHLFFESSVFYDRIDIKKGEFQYIYLYRSLFKSLIHINNLNISNNNHNDLKIKNLTVHANSFEQNVSIYLLEIESINLSDNQFNRSFHLRSSQDEMLATKTPLRFSISGTNYGNIVIDNRYLDIDIDGINFGNISFKDVKIDFLIITDFQNTGKLSFSNVIDGNFFVIQNSTIGKTMFLNTNINNFKEIVISDSNIEDTYFSIYPQKIRSYSKNPTFGFGVSDKSKNIINLRNTYNQLKQVAKKNGDIDVANQYQSLEHKNLLLSKKISLDSILLTLNWLSNNNGQSWFRGILFTLSTTLIFFYLYIIVLNVTYDNTSFFQDYILFLTSFPKLQLDKFSELNNFWKVSIVIWLSRIFISYGIYQTVSAFRKYGK